MNNFDSSEEKGFAPFLLAEEETAKPKKNMETNKHPIVAKIKVIFISVVLLVHEDFNI